MFLRGSGESNPKPPTTQGMSVSEREWSERVRNLEASQRRQLAELREANEKGLELAQESMKQVIDPKP